MIKLVQSEDPTRSHLAEQGFPDAVRGLSGLIMLGNAWESVDIFNTLAQALDVDGKNDTGYLAGLRIKELLQAGKHSLHPGAQNNPALLDELWTQQFLQVRDQSLQNQYQRTYTSLRADAETYQRNRTAYMMTRLQAGRHPDTDAQFWDQWQEPPRPTLGSLTPNPIVFWSKMGKIVLFLILAVPLLTILGVVSRRVRRNRIISSDTLQGR